MENTAPDFINLLIKSYPLNLFPFSQPLIKKPWFSSRFGAEQGNHNPKVASSNLATATTKSCLP